MSALPGQMQHWFASAAGAFGDDDLQRLLVRMIEIPSPTGEEKAIGEFLAAYMIDGGFEARYQARNATQGNVIARLRGQGGGPDLILYAPLDTAFSGRIGDDYPWLGIEPRDDMAPTAKIENGFVVGLGAHNPKGHAACVIAATMALVRAKIPLRGDVVVALCGGAMPTNGPPGIGPTVNDIGHGSGCNFALEQGLTGDFAVVAKAGTVSWEEVGLCWFRIRVKGLVGYAGTRHVVKYLNPIVHAAKVIERLEAWFPEYTGRNTSGTTAPQGSIGCIQAGWPYKPTFSPATCEVYVDLRVNPRMSPMQVRRQFADAIARIAGEIEGCDLDWEMILAVPGTETRKENWIVQSGMRAWQSINNEVPTEPTNTSGATEANVLRRWGIPTVRLGLPRPPVLGRFAGMFGMGEVHVASMRKLTDTLIYSAIDTCGRTRHDVGIGP